MAQEFLSKFSTKITGEISCFGLQLLGESCPPPNPHFQLLIPSQTQAPESTQRGQTPHCGICPVAGAAAAKIQQRHQPRCHSPASRLKEAALWSSPVNDLFAEEIGEQVSYLSISMDTPYSPITLLITRRTSFCLLLLGSMGYMIYGHKETEESICSMEKPLHAEWWGCSSYHLVGHSTGRLGRLSAVSPPSLKGDWGHALQCPPQGCLP
eukprot:bmy_09825T0